MSSCHPSQAIKFSRQQPCPECDFVTITPAPGWAISLQMLCPLLFAQKCIVDFGIVASVFVAPAMAPCIPEPRLLVTLCLTCFRQVVRELGAFQSLCGSLRDTSTCREIGRFGLNLLAPATFGISVSVAHSVSILWPHIAVAGASRTAPRSVVGPALRCHIRRVLSHPSTPAALSISFATLDCLF